MNNKEIMARLESEGKVTHYSANGASMTVILNSRLSEEEKVAVAEWQNQDILEVNFNTFP